MFNSRTSCLTAVICTSLTFSFVGQKKPSQQPPVKIQPQAGPDQLAMDRNKVPVRQLYEEMFSRGRYDLLDQVFARNARVHFGDNRHISLEEAVGEGKGWRSAAPDLQMTINNLTVNGEMVEVAWTARGTHTGHGHGIKPTGKPVLLQGRSKFHVVNGKIVEAWNEEYRPQLFRQIGVSRTEALMFFGTEKILSVLDPIIPDRLYAVVFE